MKKNEITFDKELSEIKTQIEKLEVLSDIYYDLSKKRYPNKEQRDIAKLKMELTKKEMLLLNYLINKKIDTVVSL